MKKAKPISQSLDVVLKMLKGEIVNPKLEKPVKEEVFYDKQPEYISTKKYV